MSVFSRNSVPRVYIAKERWIRAMSFAEVTDETLRAAGDPQRIRQREKSFPELGRACKSRE